MTESQGGFTFTERLTESGANASIGTVGDALAETINELYKTELSKPLKHWRTVEQAQVATAEWVDRLPKDS